MTQYLSYTFSEIKGEVDILIALLTQFEFQSYEERNTDMVAYITEEDAESITEGDLEAINDIVSFSLKVEKVENKNWNAEWESSFKPIFMDDFCCIRADFHSADHDCEYDLIINPKMAFGTGHHETTYMMMSEMRFNHLKDKNVFDYGCGTGVLAILAEKLGATDIYAIDYDIESVNNTLENLVLNNCSNITTEHKEIQNIEARQYDVILANINRHVLLSHADDLMNLCHKESRVLLSGILEQDENIVMETYNKAGFTLLKKQQRGEWLCLSLGISA